MQQTLTATRRDAGPPVMPQMKGILFAAFWRVKSPQHGFEALILVAELRGNESFQSTVFSLDSGKPLLRA